MTQLVQRAPPLIPQQVRGIIDAERSQDSLQRDCNRLASMMPRNCCGIKGGTRFTNCVILLGLGLAFQSQAPNLLFALEGYLARGVTKVRMYPLFHVVIP